MPDVPATAVAKILPPDPLNHDVPIVDPQGRPTPQFIQQWLKSRGLTLAVDANATAAVDGVYTSLDNYYTKAEVDEIGIPFMLSGGTSIKLPLEH